MQSEVLSHGVLELDTLPFELAALASAQRYQSWVFETIQPFLGKRILEIGAGIGNMSAWLPVQERLILTETDPELHKILLKSVEAVKTVDPRISVQKFDVLTDSIEPFVAENLDTVVSFNVLEHIDDDEKAFQLLCQILKQSRTTGSRRLITFVPAHNWAYGSLDKTFGHHRRYSSSRIRELSRKLAPEAKLTLGHFNTVGLLGWLVNGRLLRKQTLGLGTVKVFEALCPMLRPIDSVLHGVLRLPIGQSLYAVWEWDPKVSS